MSEFLCESCVHAEWDYEAFYNTSERQYFVTGCNGNPQCGKTDADGQVIECDEWRQRDEV